MIEVALGTALIVALVLTLSLIVMGARALLMPDRSVWIILNGKNTIAAHWGEKLLAVLNARDVPIPSACAGAGTCGLCKVRILSGAGAPLPTEQARLSRHDMHDGYRLACQIVVRDPLSIEVSDDILDAESWNTTVVSSTMLAPLIKEIVLEPPADVAFSFRAGSFAQVSIPRYALPFSDIAVDQRFEPLWRTLGWRDLTASNSTPTQRAYSIASRPADNGQIVLIIRLAVPAPGAAADVPPGIGSSYLFGLKPGDAVEVSGPFGDFHVQESDRELVFIGGGVGMAPLRAMIHEQLAAGGHRKMSLWYGARTGADILYREELDTLAAENENFSWMVALSEPTPNDHWDGPIGFVHEVAFERYLKAHPAPDDCEFYLCGPPLMIQAVLAMLDDCGVEPASIYNDDFGG